MDETPASDSAPSRARKSPSAFRTISEVATDLDVPQHVLRFWETKFPQLKPLKRGGGRRYYRPEDVLLLQRVRDLLYRDGYTIKGVQRLLRDGGREGKGEQPQSDEAVREPVTEEASISSSASPEAAAEPTLRSRGLGDAQREELEAIRAELMSLRDRLRAGTV